MECQITPEQGKDLALKLRAVSINLKNKERIEAAVPPENWVIYLCNPPHLREHPRLEEAYRQLIEYVSSSEEVEKYFKEVAPHLYVCANTDPTFGMCHIIQDPWPSDFTKIRSKMVRSDNFITSFENAVKIGMNVYLSEEEKKSLEDCLYPVDEEYIESVLSEVESITYYEEQDIIDIFNSIRPAKTSPSPVQKESLPPPQRGVAGDDTSCVAGIAFVVGIVVACIIAICL